MAHYGGTRRRLELNRGVSDRLKRHRCRPVSRQAGSQPTLITMKRRPGSGPNRTREASEVERFNAAADDDDSLSDDARPRAIVDGLDTAEVAVARNRHTTLMSPITAMLAKSMVDDGSGIPRRDPAAPPPVPVERTPRVIAAPPPAAFGPPAKPDLRVAPWRQRAAQRIDEARAASDVGDLTRAAIAAEEALREADDAPPPGIAEVIEPARPILTRALTTYVGPFTGLPILAPRAADIARRSLASREQGFLRRVDGIHTIAELFHGSGLGSTDALRIVARLLLSGAIRIL